MRRFLLGLLLALGLPLAAQAQVSVSPSATHQDAATTSCTYSAALAVAQQETTTCTPPAGQFVYITAIFLSACSDATGAAVGVTDFTTTNLTGSPTFPVGQISGAGACSQWSIALSTPLKSTAAGTAVTVVSPSTSTHLAYQATVLAYFAP